MPFRRAQRPPDLERVARVLGAGPPSSGRPSARSSEPDAGESRSADPSGPAGLPAVDEESEPAGGWVPSPPDGARAPTFWSSGTAGAGPGAARLGSVLRRLTERATEDEVSRLDADLRRARRPGVLTVPDELRAGRRGLTSAAVVSMLALVVAVGCAFVLRVLWAERSASASERPAAGAATVQVVGGTARGAAVPGAGTTRTPPVGPGDPTAGAPSRDGLADAGGSGGTAGAAPPGGSVVVHVVGQVNRPGLVQLRQGARVADAITAAGGTRRGADVSVLNLARLVQDGEQIRVPKPGERLVAAPGSGTSGGAASAGAGGASGGSAVAGPPVSLNAADVAALDTLPGVGPVLAQRIVDWRTEHGRFTSVDELGEVSGIGDKLMAQLRPKVTL
ncbi:hypothetical protein GCM10009740_12340 [Terrabacter terrae]|uniref:Soluble ligand binding domain-containing protein n=1 Tax=Terrabacter terrae TaxID=318434 RepID=A0ABN2TXM8_9MICO